jgi:hypothetical protein
MTDDKRKRAAADRSRVFGTPGNLSCSGRHFHRTSGRGGTLSNSGAGTSHPENPARLAVGHYNSLVRISTWQRRSDSDHDRWTLERHRLGPWRRR